MGLDKSALLVASWEGRSLGGGVRLGAPVARGGFGVVHQGFLPNGELVAVKLLLGVGDTERVEAFRREMELLAALRHPNLAAIRASGVTMEGGAARPWMATEWCRGWTLAVELKRRAGRKHTRAEAWGLLGPLVDAVAHAHASGCVHRDIKPANVMVEADPSNPSGLRARLIDWGIGKRVAVDEKASVETGTMSALQAFTEAYAAPEQVAGTRTGPWTDVHALALLFVELLVGERPYGKAGGFAAILDPTRPTPATFGVDAGPWEGVLAQALALRPTERFRTAAELWAALAHADRRPTTNTPALTPVAASSPPPRAGRRWLGAAIGAGAALALGVGAGLVLLPGSKRAASSAAAVEGPSRTPEPEPRAAATAAASAAAAARPEPRASAPPAPAPLRAIASLEAMDLEALDARAATLGFSRKTGSVAGSMQSLSY